MEEEVGYNRPNSGIDPMEMSGQNSFKISIPKELDAHVKLAVIRTKGLSAVKAGKKPSYAIRDACSIFLWAALRNGLITDEMILSEMKNFNRTARK